MQFDQQQLVRNISRPIYESKTWLKLVGGLSMVYGLLIALSIIGLIVAWIPFWMGFLLYKTASLVEVAYSSGEEAVLVESLSKLKTYFTITGIFALIGIVVAGLGIAFGMLGMFAGFANL